MKKLLFITLLTFASVATALDYPVNTLIDYRCQSDCMAKGYMYGYCQRICSY